MTLAQVVYNISKDKDFADEWKSNPDAALQKKGFKLSKAEIAFLSSGLNKKGSSNINFAQVVDRPTGMSWMA